MEMWRKWGEQRRGGREELKKQNREEGYKYRERQGRERERWRREREGGDGRAMVEGWKRGGVEEGRGGSLSNGMQISYISMLYRVTIFLRYLCT